MIPEENIKALVAKKVTRPCLKEKKPNMQTTMHTTQKHRQQN